MEDETKNIRLIVRAKNNLLLEKREEMGFTQQQMAGYCDISFANYGKAERLLHIPYDQAKKVALVLETTIEKLFPNWLELYGETINNQNSYYLLNNEYAQKQLENKGSTKLITESFHADIENALNSLDDERSAKVLKWYFGINGTKSLTLQEIGTILNLQPERVRQIKEKALRNLRHTKRAGILRKYLGDQMEEGV